MSGGSVSEPSRWDSPLSESQQTRLSNFSISSILAHPGPPSEPSPPKELGQSPSCSPLLPLLPLHSAVAPLPFPSLGFPSQSLPPTSTMPQPLLDFNQAISQATYRRSEWIGSGGEEWPEKLGGEWSEKLGGQEENAAYYPRKQRTVYHQYQIRKLEDAFRAQQYMVGADRVALSRQLGLSETQVRVWFQNRRSKWRKEMRDHIAANRATPTHA